MNVSNGSPYSRPGTSLLRSKPGVLFKILLSPQTQQSIVKIETNLRKKQETIADYLNHDQRSEYLNFIIPIFDQVGRFPISQHTSKDKMKSSSLEGFKLVRKMCGQIDLFEWITVRPLGTPPMTDDEYTLNANIYDFHQKCSGNVQSVSYYLHCYQPRPQTFTYLLHRIISHLPISSNHFLFQFGWIDREL